MVDIGLIRQVLDSKVYVDQSVKEALIEFFSIQNVREAMFPHAIFCLFGPPGTGKSTIIQTLCAAMSWHLIRIPIGNTEDADGMLLGTRRSDLNAIAGRIIHALNGMPPSTTVVVLEDLHQLDSSLLSHRAVDFFEILKYMQDYAIRNKYQTTPIDFSQTYFAATAHNLAAIPSGWREQMMIIPVPSFIEKEKLTIAEHFILPCLTHEYGLDHAITLSKNALLAIIRHYTREAGVAELHNNLKKLCKVVAKRIHEEGIQGTIKISVNQVARYLGPARFQQDDIDEEPQIGVVHILGRSDRGGCVIALEALALEGDGKLVITGNTDNTFQESAIVVRDYIRSQASQLGIDEHFYEKYDIHLHVSKGSIPKYGVSAGIAICTVLVSALSGKPVKARIGMTGEISLHGKILGVRDLRDKVIAASQAGLKTVFIPSCNKMDLQTIPKETKAEVNISFMENLFAVLKEALVWE